MSKLMSVVVVALAVLLALYYPKALGWLVATYAYSVLGLLVPIFGGFILRKSNLLSAKGAMGSMMLGVSGAAGAKIIGNDIQYVAFVLLDSLVGFFLFSYIDKGKNSADEFEKDKEEVQI